MKHVVTYEPHLCPKCGKENMGSAEAILDLLICPKCAEKYRNELMPTIEKLVRDYFQPERLNPEESYSEFGTSTGISFITSEGVKTMKPGRIYDQNLNEIRLCDSPNSANK